MTRIDLQQMPRWCPLCHRASIIGHGQRRKSALDEQQIAFGYGAGCVGCAARRSPFCQVGRRRMGITLCAADNKPGTRTAPTVSDGNRPHLTAKIPRDCRSTHAASMGLV